MQPAQQDVLTGEVWTFLPSRALKAHRLKNELKMWAVCVGGCVERVTVNKNEDGFWFYECGRPVLFYRTRPHSLDGGKHVSANYVHPLLGLDGETLTDDFPSDHRHHHGVFWAWHQLWIGDRRVGDSWADKNFLPVVREVCVLEQGPVFATVRVKTEWTSPLFQDATGAPRPFVEEHTTVRVFRHVGDYQYVDFQIKLVPLVKDVKIGGAENVKEYSGFTVRVHAPENIRITTDAAGCLNHQDAVGARARWVDVTGLYKPGGKLSGVAVLSSPQLPEFPPRWLLRHYGAQNVIYPGRHPVKLSRRQPLVLRHRLVVHRGSTSSAHIEFHQQLFEQQEQKPDTKSKKSRLQPAFDNILPKQKNRKK